MCIRDSNSPSGKKLFVGLIGMEVLDQYMDMDADKEMQKWCNSDTTTIQAPFSMKLPYGKGACFHWFSFNVATTIKWGKSMQKVEPVSFKGQKVRKKRLKKVWVLFFRLFLFAVLVSILVWGAILCVFQLFPELGGNAKEQTEREGCLLYTSRCV